MFCFQLPFGPRIPTDQSASFVTTVPDRLVKGVHQPAGLRVGQHSLPKLGKGQVSLALSLGTGRAPGGPRHPLAGMRACEAGILHAPAYVPMGFLIMGLQLVPVWARVAPKKAARLPSLAWRCQRHNALCIPFFHRKTPACTPCRLLTHRGLSGCAFFGLQSGCWPQAPCAERIEAQTPKARTISSTQRNTILTPGANARSRDFGACAGAQQTHPPNYERFKHCNLPVLHFHF